MPNIETPSERSPGKDAGIVVLFFILLGILWYIQGGAEKSEKPFIKAEPDSSATFEFSEYGLPTVAKNNKTNADLNKCSGYLAQTETFEPELPILCPLPKNENWPFFLSSECKKYIETIPRCQTPENIPPSLGKRCSEIILEKLNYETCVGEHKKDEDFYFDI
ncbi:hypothetical protein KJ751_02710 [Patescibacteria group bacterium]|nr:hypothetical protein [Patescibacteria group bacterium]